MDLITQIRKYPNFKLFIKFCVVGACAALINFTILYTGTEQLNLWYVYSSVLAYLLAAVFNFTTNKFWTFRNNQAGLAALKQMIMFSVVVISGLTINTFFIYILTEYSGLDYRLSWVVATGLVTFWSFTLNKFWTFKHVDQSLV